ncbi:unnamed protein product [Lathyrus oleraceus]|uniref:Uncharacterized protein n=1 Tax=Pisum sativum TaxID=3888 RepID=A0A9D4XY84_PEA|nr:uncharacterized protein LOC127127119 [Pisum sativum]KAI5428757.1 hypothetical protein KIW84_033672 [Pisum sativum]
MAPEISKTREAVRSSEDQDSDSELEKLEYELKKMSQKILECRETLPDQLKSTLISVLDEQRSFLPQISPGTLEQNMPSEEDPETAEKLKLLNEKISSNYSAAPVVLKRMKDCIAKFEKLDSANMHPGVKRKEIG